jgi:hypothetical protein
VAGSYYPALVAACALGERILNHLVLDLRDHFKSSEHYKKLYRKESFDDWPFAVSVLTDWNVLVDGVGAAFLALGELRNRSIHFNPETYKLMRDDALAALRQLNDMVAKQFGMFGGQPWFIENTAGAQFIKRGYESHPFVKSYLVPRSGFIGPLYGMELTQEGFWAHLDYADYGDVEFTDEEFARQHRERDPAGTRGVFVLPPRPSTTTRSTPRNPRITRSSGCSCRRTALLAAASYRRAPGSPPPLTPH